jgi:hypothetical protein
MFNLEHSFLSKLFTKETQAPSHSEMVSHQPIDAEPTPHIESPPQSAPESNQPHPEVLKWKKRKETTRKILQTIGVPVSSN